VLVFHVWQQAAPGGASVDLGPFSKVFDMLSAGVALFFVLSGFLLFQPFVAAAIRGTRPPAVGAYLRNRLLRIAPAYLTIVLVVALVFEREIRENLGRLLANVFLVEYYVPGYVGSDLHSANAGIAIIPSWSLAVEVVFYLSLPVLGYAAIRAAARHGRNPVVASFGSVAFMVVLGVGAKLVSRTLADGPGERVWNFAFPVHADWFAWGMSLAILHVLWQDGRLRLPARWRPTCVLTSLTIAAVAVKLYYAGTLTRLEAQSLLAFCCGLLLALVVLEPKDGVPRRILCSKPLVATGLASYSLFLWHDPLLRALRDHGLTQGGTAGFVVNLALVGAVAGVASALTYNLVERPALSLKHAWRRGGAVRPVQPEQRPLAEPGGGRAPVARPSTDLSLSLLLRARSGTLRWDFVSVREEVQGLLAELDPGDVHDVAISVAPDLRVWAEPTLLRDIVGALLGNAFLYGSPPVNVRAERVAGSFVLCVEDHGRGVGSEFVPHLFEPYMRSEASTAAASGEGLGLARAQAYARMQDGRLLFAPVAPHGASFRLVLPDVEVGAPTSSRSVVAGGMAPSASTTSAGEVSDVASRAA
jgi:peptidoglycan/LPS O-acetylase OafA/YrhL